MTKKAGKTGNLATGQVQEAPIDDGLVRRAEEEPTEVPVESLDFADIQIGLMATVLLLDPTTQRNHKQAVWMARELDKASEGSPTLALTAALLCTKQPDGMAPLDAMHIARKLTRLSAEFAKSEDVAQ